MFADPDDTSRVTYGSAAGRLTLDLTTVCRLRTGVDWKGAPRWRWLLFFALWPLLHWISYGIASLISAALLNIQFLSSVCPPAPSLCKFRRGVNSRCCWYCSCVARCSCAAPRLPAFVRVSKSQQAYSCLVRHHASCTSAASTCRRGSCH